MRGKRLDTDDLLSAIIAEAEVALRRASFEPNIERIHRLVDIIEQRMRMFSGRQAPSLIDELMAKTEGRRID